MPLTGDFLRYWLSVDGPSLNPQPDPNLSLGGAKSSTRAENVVSVPTSVPDAWTIVDATLAEPIPPPAPSPDARTPLEDSGAYSGFTDQLIHWWRFGLDGDDIGADYGPVATADGPIDAIADGVGISKTDLVNVQPGQFNQQRKSLQLDGTSQGCWSDFSARIGVGGFFSLQAWVRPTTVAAGTAKIIDWRRSAGLENNRFTMERQGAALHVRQVDVTSSLAIREEIYAGFFAANTWVCIGLIYHAGISGEDRLRVWKNGVLTAKTGGNLTNANRTDQDSDLSHGANAAASSQWFQGQIHSVALWLSILSSAAMVDLAGFGDGDTVPDPPQTDYSGSWVTFAEGALQGELNRVRTWDPDTGTAVFDNAWSVAPTVADEYRLCAPSGLFAEVGPSEAISGDVAYRMVWVGNDTGVGLANYRAYLEPLEPGPILMEVSGGTDSFVGTSIDPIPDENTAPDLADPGYTPGAKVQEFGDPRTWAQAMAQPRDGAEPISGSSFAPIWLKRTVRPLSLPCDRCVWLLWIEVTNGGGDPDPFRVALPIVFDVAGFVEAKELGTDRKLRVGGGARVQVTVTEETTGAPVVGLGVSLELVPPSPGTLQLPGGLLETNSEGVAEAVYLSPTDPGEEGADVTFRAKV